MNYDSIIIGFGKAGKTLTGALAKAGKKVALIEQSNQMYGGTCINVGCIPSKSLVTSAQQAKQLGQTSMAEKAAFYAQAIVEKRRVTGLLRQKNYAKLHDLPNVTIIDGKASFIDDHTISVSLTDGKTETLTADYIYLNTGATPVIPPIPGILDNPYVYTSATLMDLDVLPSSLILIGAGYIGMEFASMYTSFGSTVTVIQDGDVFLPKEDRDVADEIKKIMEKRGVTFIMGAKITEVDGPSISYVSNNQTSKIKGDAILVATGRKPNTADLHCEKAGVTLTERQAIKVDDQLKTSVSHIWALGDCNGGPQFTYASLDDFRIALAQRSGGDYSLAKRSSLPYSVFMDLPLGRVGLTEQQAQKLNLPFKVLKMPTAAVPKAQVLRQTDGFLKVLVNTENDQIIGAALLCPQANEMINTLKLAMDTHTPASVLKNMIYTHPTMTEAFNDLFAM